MHKSAIQNSEETMRKLVLVVVICLAAAKAWAAGYMDIRVLGTETHDIRFVSGHTVYVEGLVKGMWEGRYWSGGGRINVPYELTVDNAFGLRSTDGALDSGWEWVGSHEEEIDRNGARHFVIELKNSAKGIGLKIHTVLDGTPILERWLEITNLGRKSVALTEVYPWTSHLWSTPYYDDTSAAGKSIFTLGSFSRITHGWEGWLQWQSLSDSFVHVESHVGHGFKAPFFVVRNELAGEYFIGHLAWSGNWDMDFSSNAQPFGSPHAGPGGYGPGKSADLWFKAGPWATLPQRVISPGESTTAGRSRYRGAGNGPACS
jgi:hypothetical protein